MTVVAARRIEFEGSSSFQEGNSIHVNHPQESQRNTKGQEEEN